MDTLFAPKTSKHMCRDLNAADRHEANGAVCWVRLC